MRDCGNWCWDESELHFLRWFSKNFAECCSKWYEWKNMMCFKAKLQRNGPYNLSHVLMNEIQWVYFFVALQSKQEFEKKKYRICTYSAKYNNYYFPLSMMACHWKCMLRYCRYCSILRLFRAGTSGILYDYCFHSAFIMVIFL